MAASRVSGGRRSGVCRSRRRTKPPHQQQQASPSNTSRVGGGRRRDGEGAQRQVARQRTQQRARTPGGGSIDIIVHSNNLINRRCGDIHITLLSHHCELPHRQLHRRLPPHHGELDGAELLLAQLEHDPLEPLERPRLYLHVVAERDPHLRLGLLR